MLHPTMTHELVS